MDKRWLANQLSQGFSIEAIARDVGRHPSTLAYWVNRHDLASSHAPKHAARGGIARETLEPLVTEGLSVQQIAERLGRGGTTVRYWLRKHELVTVHAMLASIADRPAGLLRRCRKHGYTRHVAVGGGSRYRCTRCRVEAVTARRRRVKAVLVSEAGGRCCLCGYERFAGALQFHHRDPGEKAFGLSNRGLAHSIARARLEAEKCVLVCANCHAEIEAGIATIDRPAAADRLG
jgi:transposase-like protein